jgi:AGCS family alanine or glycine:cation symporter
MYIDTFNSFLDTVSSLLWGWPLIGFILASGVVFTVTLGFVQFRYFGTAWSLLFKPEASQGATISPLQAFLNTLSASVGNGSLTGMATAIYSGGPGAAFWVFVIGFFSMAIRYAEVFCGTSVAVQLPNGSVRGGPLAYIGRAPGGSVLVPIYMICVLWLTFASGCAMQCQAITGGLVHITGWSPYIFAGILFVLLVYIMSGGAQRVLKVSDTIVPVKVLLFVVATLIALVWHAGNLLDALYTIVGYALTPAAMKGGLIGFTVQNAIRYGLVRSSNATESGIGTAGILYGATGSQHPVRSGLVSMITTLISNHVVCFSVMLLIVASGAWQSGVEGVNMTIDAYASVFGAWGAIVVTVLSIMFGLGVLVTYVYIGRECWMFMSNGKYVGLYYTLYALCALGGSLGQVSIVWKMIDIAVAGLLITNLYALWIMLPEMRAALRAYQRHQHS